MEHTTNQVDDVKLDTHVLCGVSNPEVEPCAMLLHTVTLGIPLRQRVVLQYQLVLGIGNLDGHGKIAGLEP